MEVLAVIMSVFFGSHPFGLAARLRPPSLGFAIALSALTGFVQ